MTARTPWRCRVAGALALLVALTVGAAAQTPAPPSTPDDPVVNPGRMSPREVQRLLDAYVAMQAQERLQLSETQYPQFLPRLKTLLDLRRTTLTSRQALVADLGRASQGGPARRTDDAALREKLQQLRAFDDQTAVDLRRAYESIDQVLDLRQQARFRVFEDQIERRKVELLMRARMNVRARAPRTPAR